MPQRRRSVILPPEGLQMVDDRADAQRRRADAVEPRQHVRDGVGAGSLQLEHRRIRGQDHDGQGLVQFMRQARRHLPERHHPRGLDQLRLRPLAFIDFLRELRRQVLRAHARFAGAAAQPDEVRHIDMGADQAAIMRAAFPHPHPAVTRQGQFEGCAQDA